MMLSIPEPLRIPDFRLYWIARFAAVLSTMGMVVIVGYQVYDVARSDYAMSIKEASFQIGLVGLSQFIPIALLTPVAGWAADRFERRTVARIANAIDMLVALALGWLTWQDSLTLPLLFTFAAMHGIARVFVNPAMAAIAPNIVPAKQLPQAIAMSSIAWQMGSVVGPALGGFLYAAHPSAPYWFAAALMLVAMIALTPIRRVVPPPIAGDRHPLRQMIEGVAYVRHHRFLLGAITLDLFAVLLGGATAMLPVYARDILMVGTEGLGLLRAAPAVGAAIVALWLRSRRCRRNVGIKMLLSVAAFGAMTIIFGVSHSMSLSLGALTLARRLRHVLGLCPLKSSSSSTRRTPCAAGFRRSPGSPFPPRTSLASCSQASPPPSSGRCSRSSPAALRLWESPDCGPIYSPS